METERQKRVREGRRLMATELFKKAQQKGDKITLKTYCYLKGIPLVELDALADKNPGHFATAVKHGRFYREDAILVSKVFGVDFEEFRKAVRINYNKDTDKGVKVTRTKSTTVTKAYEEIKAQNAPDQGLVIERLQQQLDKSHWLNDRERKQEQDRHTEEKKKAIVLSAMFSSVATLAL